MEAASNSTERPDNRIEELRLEAGVARVELAALCEVGEMTIRRWERNESEVSDEQKFRLAAYLSRKLARAITVEHLMGWDREPIGGRAA